MTLTQKNSLMSSSIHLHHQKWFLSTGTRTTAHGDKQKLDSACSWRNMFSSPKLSLCSNLNSNTTREILSKLSTQILLQICHTCKEQGTPVRIEKIKTHQREAKEQYCHSTHLNSQKALGVQGNVCPHKVL